MSGKACLFVLGLMLLALPVFSASASDGEALVNDACMACHEQTDNGGLTRISEVRKTPEGWDMTIFRMQHLHGLELADDDRFAIIKYLSAEHGLAPSEAAHYDIGGEFSAVRMDGAETQVMLKSSDYIRVGESKEITLHGVGLTGKVKADKGLNLKVIKQNETSVTLKIAADKNITPGPYKVTVGQAGTEIIVYDKVESVRVTPDWTIARLGGGKTPPVTAQFEAVAFMKGD